MNTGVKVFVKHSTKDKEIYLRISQEGISWLFPFLTKRIVPITEEDFYLLIDEKDPQLHKLSSPAFKALNEAGIFYYFFIVFVNFIVDQGPVVFQLGKNCKNEGWDGYIFVFFLFFFCFIDLLLTFFFFFVLK